MRVVKLNNRGDTIIEVLVCLAVLSFVLVLSYSLVTKSQRTIRGAQERVEALKLAEGQIEQLKSKQKDSPAGFTVIANKPINQPYCLNNGTATNISTLPPNIWNSVADQDNFSAYPGQCGLVSGLYNVSVTSPGNGSGGLFTVRVHWDRIGGGGREEVKLVYNLYAN